LPAAVKIDEKLDSAKRALEARNSKTVCVAKFIL